MEPSSPGKVVRQGTFVYDGLRICKVRIVETDFCPGSGDHEDSSCWREDKCGTFYRVDYASPRSDRFCSGGGHFLSIEDALKAVANNVEKVVWDQ